MADKDKKSGSSASKLLLAIVAAVLVFLGTLLGECGLGFGLGPGLRAGLDGAQTGAEPTPSAPPVPSASATVAPTASAAPPTSCVLRLDSEGLKLDGKPSEIPAAVEACKRSGKAELITTGDAKFGDHESLRKALHEANVFVLERQP